MLWRKTCLLQTSRLISEHACAALAVDSWSQMAQASEVGSVLKPSEAGPLSVLGPEQNADSVSAWNDVRQSNTLRAKQNLLGIPVCQLEQFTTEAA